MSRTNRDIKIKKVKKLRKNHLCKNHINYDNIFIDTSLCKKQKSHLISPVKRLHIVKQTLIRK